MQIEIQAIRFHAKNQLQEFVRQQITKLKRFHSQILNAEVYLRLEKDEEQENKLVEINLRVPGRQFFAKEQARSFEAAARLTTDALARQLVRAKKK